MACGACAEPGFRGRGLGRQAFEGFPIRRDGRAALSWSAARLPHRLGPPELCPLSEAPRVGGRREHDGLHPQAVCPSDTALVERSNGDVARKRNNSKQVAVQVLAKKPHLDSHRTTPAIGARTPYGFRLLSSVGAEPPADAGVRLKQCAFYKHLGHTSSYTWTGSRTLVGQGMAVMPTPGRSVSRRAVRGGRQCVPGTR